MSRGGGGGVQLIGERLRGARVLGVSCLSLILMTGVTANGSVEKGELRMSDISSSSSSSSCCCCWGSPCPERREGGWRASELMEMEWRPDGWRLACVDPCPAKTRSRPPNRLHAHDLRFSLNNLHTIEHPARPHALTAYLTLCPRLTILLR